MRPDPSRTGPLWTWPPPAEDLGQGRNQWQVFARHLTEHGLGTAVTTDEPVPAWTRRLTDRLYAFWNEAMPWEVGIADPNQVLREPYLMVEDGLAVQDLYALAPMVALSGVPLPSNAALGFKDIARDHFGQCTVRAVVGWLMASAQAGDGTVEQAARWAREADEVGLGSDGWWYALAGFAPGEIVRARAAGDLEVDVVRGMVALRGGRTPAGADRPNPVGSTRSGLPTAKP